MLRFYICEALRYGRDGPTCDALAEKTVLPDAVRRNACPRGGRCAPRWELRGLCALLCKVVERLCAWLCRADADAASCTLGSAIPSSSTDRSCTRMIAAPLRLRHSLRRPSAAQAARLPARRAAATARAGARGSAAGPTDIADPPENGGRGWERTGPPCAPRGPSP
jgi:hypothetical protein